MQSKSDNPVSVQASPWILRDPNVPDMEFATEAEALAAAASAIEEYLDIDGWNFEVQDVHVLRDGVMTHRATEVKQDTPEDELEAMEDAPEYRPPFDYYCNYEMLPVQSRVLPGDDAQGSQGYPALGLGGDEGEK
jgi:hypothetical protein